MSGRPAQAIRSGATRTILPGLVLLALALGLVVRVIGIDHGRPTWVWHPDVAKQSQVAEHIFQGDLELTELFGGDVQRTLYPYGTSVMLGHAMKVRATWAGFDRVLGSHRWFWAYRLRWLAVILFMGAVLAALFGVRRGWTAAGALAASLLMVLEPGAALDSHYGMNDVPLAALLLLAWVGSLYMPEEPVRLPWASVLTGFLLGLAFGVKYQAVLAGIFPLAAWIRMSREREGAGLVLSLLGLGTAGVAGMLYASPLLRSDPWLFITQLPAFMQWQTNIMETPLPFSEKVVRNLVAVAYLLLKGHVLLLIGAGYGTWAIVRDPKRRWLVTSVVSAWLFTLLLLAVVVTGRDIVRANDLLPVWPLLALLFGLGLSAPQPRRIRRGAVLLAVALIAVFGTRTFLDVAALARPDTRERARTWCLDQAPPGSLVLRERYTLALEQPQLREQVTRYLASREVRGVIRRGEPDFLVSSSLAYDRFYDKKLPYFDPDVQAFYEALPRYYQLVAEFTDRRLPFAHPVIRIYQPRSPSADEP